MRLPAPQAGRASTLHAAGPPMHSLYRALCLMRPPMQHRPLGRAAAAAAAAAEAAHNAPAAAACSPASPAAAAGEQHGPHRLQFDSWKGLQDWRASGVDARTVWGPKGPVEPSAADADAAAAALLAAADAVAAQRPSPASLAEAARAVLLTPDPLEKAALSFRAWRAFSAGQLPVVAGEAPPPLEGPPARPAVPELVNPRKIPSMDKSSLPKPVYMLHNLAHVELNAVDLAWDTVLRFAPAGLPRAFYADFARIADEESRHLSWCLQRLRELGHAYGCMPAHNLLWEGAEASQADLGARLAVVPMSQEARGLDAGDRLAQRLVGMGDNRTSAIVRRIAEEERAHVAVGVTWFSSVCAALDADPGPAFRRLLLGLCPGLLKGPFNDAERQRVGLPADWYDPRLWADDPELQAAAEVAVAAAARGDAMASAAAAGGEGRQALLADPAVLGHLAQRLGVLLELEAGAAAGPSTRTT